MDPPHWAVRILGACIEVCGKRLRLQQRRCCRRSYRQQFLKAWCAEAPHLGVSSGGVEVEGTVFMRASLTGNGSSHLGVSSGGVEVDGTVFVRASLTGNGSPSSGRQLRRGGSGWWVCQSCRPPCREKTVRIYEALF